MVYDPSKAFETIGTAFGEAMRERWNKKEYEDFQSTAVAAFEQESQAVLQQIAENDDNPDALVSGFQSFKKAQMKFLTAAGKFGNNPLIAQLAQNVWQVNSGSLTEFLQMEEAGQKRSTREEDRERMLAGEDLTRREKEQGILTDKAQAGYYTAQAGALGRDKQTAERQANSFRFNSVTGNSIVNPVEFLKDATTRTEKWAVDEIHAMSVASGMEFANLEIRAKIEAGERKPDGTPWDLTADATAWYQQGNVDPQLIQTDVEKKLLQKHGYNPEDPRFEGKYTPPWKRASEVAQQGSMGSLFDQEVVELGLGANAYETEFAQGKLREGENKADIDPVEYAKRFIPPSLSDLPESHMKATFKSTFTGIPVSEMTRKDRDPDAPRPKPARGRNPHTGKLYKDMREVDMFVLAEATAWAGERIGLEGQELDDRQKENRRQLVTMYWNAWSTYRQSIGEQLGLITKAPEKSFLQKWLKNVQESAAPYTPQPYTPGGSTAQTPSSKFAAEQMGVGVSEKEFAKGVLRKAK